MSQSGVSVSPECINVFNELKLGKGTVKFIIYKLSDDYKEIVVEDSSQDTEYEVFREKLLSAKAKGIGGSEGPGPRFAVYDFEYDLKSGEGKRNKITFIAWSPDNAGIKPKMTYASSKDALKRSLNGIAVELQANDRDDIEYETIIKDVSKGTAA
ncbi:MAG: cofilin [Vezdaea acicularis]|nr:MAG: cofilin [Vezdaea acicularis]